MEEKKYQIFVSSTYKDLVKARDNVIQTILTLYHFPVGMEMFSADDAEQWEIIEETINISDYYIVLIGHRYGSETAEGLSFTEKEYDYAKEQKIPILAFIRNRDVATKPEERDDDQDKISKLNNFIDKATKNKMCDFWENEDELAKQVAVALSKITRKTPRIGWIRANMAMSPEVSEELTKLSRENRELREENEALLSQLTDRKPSIGINFNNTTNLKLKFKNIDKMDYPLLKYPKEIAKKRIPNNLLPFLKQEDIEAYNKSLPAEEDIDKYNNSLEMFWRLMATGQDFSVNIFNQGSIKANEINVEIDFPDEIVILDKIDIEDLEPPENPMPEDPLKKAQIKYQKEQRRRLNPLSALGLDIQQQFSGYHPPSSLFNVPINIPRPNLIAEIRRDYSTPIFAPIISDIYK